MRIAENNEPAAKNISRIIKGKGLKQVHVATEAGYAPQEFSDMLNGRKIIRALDMVNIANALGVTPGELFQTEEDE